MDRKGFSWDLNPGPPQKSMAAIIPVDKPEDSNLGENTAAERGKAVKLAKGGAFSTPDIAISALSQHPCVYRPAVTLLFRSEPLSLPGISYRHENSNQSPFFSQQRSTVLLGGS